MTYTKHAPMPEAWQNAASGFIEYKRAAGLRETSLLTLWRRLRAFAAEVDTPPQSVTYAQLLAYLASRKAIETKRGCRNLFTAFFAWCKDTGLRDDDPAAKLPHVRRATPHPKPCPESAIAEALRKATPETRLMVLLASECGLRRGEICRVHSDDVITGTDGNHSLIVHGKGGKQRVIPLPEDVAATILKARGYVFRGRFGGHVEASYVGKRVSRLLPDGYSCHKLRHRFATVAYSDSHDMLAVARALGHVKIDTTQAYVALSEESLRSLVDAAALDHSATGGYSLEDTGGDDGKLHSSAADDLLAVTLLAWGIADAMREGKRSFRIDAMHLARRWRIGKEDANRAAIMHDAAKHLESLGIVDLASGEEGCVRGNCHASAELLDMVTNEYWRRWQTNVLN